MTPANEASRYAQDARDRLDDVLRQVRRVGAEAVKDAATRAGHEVSFLDESLATVSRRKAEKAASLTPELSERIATVEKQVGTIRRRYNAARRGEDIAAIEGVLKEASAARLALDALIQSFGPTTLEDRGVRKALVEGSRLFFAGEYQQVLATLDPANPELANAQFQVHTHLFRAASLYALYVRSGDKDQALRTQALAEVDVCKRLDPALVPDARAFAPRFISFYQNGGKAAPAARAALATQ